MSRHITAWQAAIDDVKARYSMTGNNERCQGTLQHSRQQWTMSRHITAWQQAMNYVKVHATTTATSNELYQGTLQQA